MLVSDVHHLGGAGLGIKMAASRTARTNAFSPVPLPPVSLSWHEPQLPVPTSPEDPLRPVGRSVPGSYEVMAFPPCPSVYKTLNAPSESTFKHSKSGVSVVKSHWPSKPNALGGSSPNARQPHWGTWHGAQNSHSPRRTSDIIIFQSVGNSPSRCGIWLYHQCALLTISFWLLCHCK